MSSWIWVSNTLKNLRLGGASASATGAAVQSRLFGAEAAATIPALQKKPLPETQLDKLYKTLELEVLAYEPSVLNSYQWFVITAATHLGIPVGKCWAPLKSDKYRFPLLKSAFVHKKHQVQYEVRTYHRFLTFHKLTGSTADTFLEYVERNLPEGVGLKITKVEAQTLPEYLQKQPST